VLSFSIERPFFSAGEFVCILILRLLFFSVLRNEGDRVTVSPIGKLLPADIVLIQSPAMVDCPPLKNSSVVGQWINLRHHLGKTVE